MTSGGCRVTSGKHVTSNLDLPVSAWYRPEAIFISVDLPAPFSPASAVIGAGLQSQGHAPQNGDAGERLLDIRMSRATGDSPIDEGTAAVAVCSIA